MKHDGTAMRDITKLYSSLYNHQLNLFHTLFYAPYKPPSLFQAHTRMIHCIVDKYESRQGRPTRAALPPSKPIVTQLHLL